MIIIKKYLLSIIIFFLSINFVFSADSFNLISPNYFGEEKNENDVINFLQDEVLSFEVCSSGSAQNFKAIVSCGDENIDLELFEKEKTNSRTCMFSNYLLSNLSCSNFDLEITYQDNNLERKIIRNFEKQKESLLLNHILSRNVDVLSPLDLSYHLVTLRLSGVDNLLADEVYEKLKNLRNNENKCWPSSSCDLEITSEILKNLQIANYPLSSRLLADGKIYLEQNLIKNHRIDFGSDNQQSNEKEFLLFFEHAFSSNEEISCDLDVDDGDFTRTYIFDENSDYSDLFISRQAENNIDLLCDDNFDKITLYTFDREIYSVEQTNRDSLSYSISSSNLQQYNNFYFRLDLRNNFLSNEEISCDLDIDGQVTTLDFDENSPLEDLILFYEFDEDFSFNCDERFDELNLKVMGGDVLSEEFLNQREFEYSINPGDRDLFKFNLIFDYNFLGSETLSCDLNIDSGNQRTYTFSSGDRLEINNRYLSDSIDFVCNRVLGELNLEIYDKFNRKQIDTISYDTEKLNYRLSSSFSEYSCIGERDQCNFYASLNALTVYKNTLEDAVKIESYVDSFIIRENNVLRTNTVDPISDSGKYLFHKRNDDVKDYLKFRQNNDGSWGSSTNNDKSEVSSNALIGLMKYEPTSEYILDGKRWIYFNEPLFGWGTHKRNTLAYIAIKEQLKPYVKIDVLNKLSEETLFEIINPTIYNIFDLEISFSDNINSNLEYRKDLGALMAQDELNFSVSVVPSFKGSDFGYFKLTGKNSENRVIELFNFPILISGPLPISFENKNYSFTQETNSLSLDVIPNFNFSGMSCSYLNPFDNTNNKINLSSQDKRVIISNENSFEGNFSIDLNCNLDGRDFIIPILGYSNLIEETFNIDLNQSSYVINSLEDFSLSLQSILQDRQVVSFEVKGNIAQHVKPVEEQKIIAGEDNRLIFFTIENPVLFEAMGNSTSGQLVIFSDTGYFKEINLTVDFSEEVEEEPMSLLFILLITIGVLFVGLVLYRIIELRRNNNSEEEFYSQDDEYFFESDDIEFK